MAESRPEPATAARDVRAFWLGSDYLTADGLSVAIQRWFTPDRALDVQLRKRFQADVERARAGLLDGWAATSPGWLALLILLDQFPRNIHRGTPMAFAADAKAQAVALDGIARGHDRHLDVVERVFAYLPLEHAEDIALQNRSVQAFRTLRDDAPVELADAFAVFLDYAIRHREVIERFGRFPHRNVILGRISTAEEQAYLARPGAGF